MSLIYEMCAHICFKELNSWKREQQLSGNGAPFSNNLDTIQKWYDLYVRPCTCLLSSIYSKHICFLEYYIILSCIIILCSF